MTEEKLRLHITPFSKELAQTILSITSSPAASTISHHTLETFPENSYGYIELPAMEGERIKKKLNGSILKGKKLRIEDARPQKRGFETEDDKDNGAPSVLHEPRASKRPKISKSELQGHELAPKRKVKRGWTEAEKGKRGSSLKHETSPLASKHTDKAECLFRVQAPPNKTFESTRLTKNEKKRDAKAGKKATVVHEFGKSVVHPSFIRNETDTGEAGVAAEYIDGKGWVDKDGIVIEEVSKRQLRKRNPANVPPETFRLPKSKLSNMARASSSDEQSSGSRVNRERRKFKKISSKTPRDKSSIGDPKAVTVVSEEATSSSGISFSGSESASQATSESDDEEELELEPETQLANPKDSEKSKDAAAVELTASPAVHPLEALFKRPNQAASQTTSKRPLEIKTTFNFFEPDEEQTIPQTPFTTRDLQLRGQRSAAPTPDTAHPTRRFFAESVSPGGDSDIDGEEDLEGPSDGISTSKRSNQKEGESDFAKWFWEHRGENNRAWKRRRREAMKDKRQRENKQNGRRSG
jgi:hypothetical protein